MSFDFLAPHYRWMEAVLAGRVLQRARVCWLEKLQGRRHVLIVGEGPGRLLEAIMKRFPDAEVTVVEQSARMIEVAKRRLTARGVLLENVRWVCTDVRTWTVSVGGCGGFDAVLTPFVLDCFSCETVELLVAELSALAKRDAVWLVTDFQVPPHGWRRMRAKAVHTMMYLFFV